MWSARRPETRPVCKHTLCLLVSPCHVRSTDTGRPVSNSQSFSFPFWLWGWASRGLQALPPSGPEEAEPWGPAGLCPGLLFWGASEFGRWGGRDRGAWALALSGAREGCGRASHAPHHLTPTSPLSLGHQQHTEKPCVAVGSLTSTQSFRLRATGPIL